MAKKYPAMAIIDKEQNDGLNSIKTLFIEGFIKDLKFGERNTARGPVKVATLRLSSQLATKKIVSNFGENYLPEMAGDLAYQNFNVTFWGKQAECIEAHPYTEGSKMIIGLRGLSECYKPGGEITRNINASAVDFGYTTWDPEKQRAPLPDVHKSICIVNRTSDSLMDGIVTMLLEGTVESVKVASRNTASGERKVANIKLTAYMGEYHVKKNFGDSYMSVIDEEKKLSKVSLNIAYWGKVAESIEAANYEPGTRLLCGLKGFAPCVIDNKVTKTVNAVGVDFPRVLAWVKKDEPEKPAAEQDGLDELFDVIDDDLEAYPF